MDIVLLVGVCGFYFNYLIFKNLVIVIICNNEKLGGS